MDGRTETDPTPQQKTFTIVSPRENDSLGSGAWKEYLDKDKLKSVWSVSVGSPYTRFQKTKTMDSITEWAGIIKPRYSEGEQTSEQGISNLIRSGQLDSHTAVILDSGGAHSVAMAIKLAEQGYQPVIMFDTAVYANASNRSEQELATLLYFAEQMKRLKEQGKIRPDSLPVFVLDIHRAESPIGRKNIVDNSYEYQPQDFPTSEELKQLDINKVVYLNEGDQNGGINQDFQSLDRVWDDLKPVVQSWQVAGIQIVYTGVIPWEPKPGVFDELRHKPRSLIGGIGRGYDNFDIESRLSYPDMQPEVYGDSVGIAMHRNRERFVFTNKGELMVINERGMSREMKPEELEQFQSEIKRHLDEQPDNEQMRKLFTKLQKK